MLYDKGKRAKKSANKEYEKAYNEAKSSAVPNFKNINKVGTRVLTPADKSQMAIYQRPDTPLAETPEPKMIQ